MRVIGLTGGIASGKSTVSRMLKSLGAEIIDADILAREIVEPGERALNNIVERFGTSILNQDGTLNRKALGTVVFNDPLKLNMLNKITHPEIRYAIVDRINEYRKSGFDGVVVVDAAVLIESGMDRLVDEVWLVYVDFDTQVDRLMERDHISGTEAVARIESQLPVEDKLRYAKRIIDNTKGIEYTEAQVKKIWNETIK